MRKYILLSILLASVFLVHCAAEQKTVQPTLIPQEKCDVPVWNVGDYWRFQYGDRSWWAHQVVRLEGDLYIVENPNDRFKYCYERKSLYFKFYLDPEGKKILPKTEAAIFYDFPLYVGKNGTR